MKVEIDELRRVTRQAIHGYGYPDDEVDTILDVLMYAQLRGNNQGVVKLIGPGMPKSPDERPVSVAKETPVSAWLSGGGKHAMVVVNHGVDVALSKARAAGLAIVGINGISTSSGAIGYYARRIAQERKVGVVMAGSRPVVAMEGSVEALLGTNPVAVGLPSGVGPVVLDFTTAAMAWYGLVEAQTAGRQIPAGIAYDGEGRPTTDPSRALEGALRPFDGTARGSGLSFMVQALTGPLLGGAFLGLGDVAGNSAGHLIIVIDPDLFVGEQELLHGVDAMAERARAARRLDGVDEILLPGERGDRATAAALDEGTVEIEDNLFRELKEVAARIGGGSG
jgi:L-2-hydroxycarboxylate dehydrogenase (NAD+)